MKYSHHISVAILLFALAGCQQSSTNFQTLSPDEFETALKKQANAQLLDVRTPEEFEGGHIQGAANLDYNNPTFGTRVTVLNKNKPVYVYCLSGSRSAGAADQMHELGFKEIYNLKGGILQWNAAGKPKESKNGSERRSGNAPTYSAEDLKKMTDSGNFVLVDYSAVWCGPCKKIAPMLESLATKNKDKLKLVKIDADANQTLFSEKGIDRIPFLELYQDGKLVWQHQGLIDEETLIRETKL
jgi:thioredoxin